jgi:serine/threonine protein kinase
MKGSHLIFQPMPMILQRVINNSKRRRSEKVDANLVSPSILTAWVHDLLTAFAHCHENHIVLRTLYPDQILFDSSGLAKLSGLTRAMVLHPSDRNRYIDPVALLSKSKGKKASSSGVTEDDILNNPYMAPELLLGATKYTSQSDMWTLGCLISHMILNKPLFSGRDRESKVHAIFKIVGTPSSTNYKQAEDFPYYSSCRLSKKYKSGVEKALRYMLKDQDSTVVDSYGGILNLLESMLVLDPKKRISAFDALHHESMKSFVNETTNENYRARFVEDWIKMKESILSSGESDDVSGADHDNITGGRNTINTGSASQELFSNGLGVSKLAGSMENVDDLYNLDDILGSNSFGGKRMKLSG